MMVYLIATVLLLTALAALATHTRSAKLKRMAYHLNLRYDEQVESVVLPESASKTRFFNRGLHQFFHVLTFRESNAFVRVCEDRIFTDPLRTTPTTVYTLVTAELTKNTLTPLILAPRTPNEPVPTNLPPELAERYTLTASENFALPPAAIGFLKAHPTCYVECTQTAFIYCELNVAPVRQIQPLRFRALQLLKELSRPSATLAPSNVSPATGLSDDVLQSQILLKLQSAAQAPLQSAPIGRYLYGIVLLILLSALLATAWYILHYVIKQ